MSESKAILRGAGRSRVIRSRNIHNITIARGRRRPKVGEADVRVLREEAMEDLIAEQITIGSAAIIARDVSQAYSDRIRTGDTLLEEHAEHIAEYGEQLEISKRYTENVGIRTEIGTEKSIKTGQYFKQSLDMDMMFADSFQAEAKELTIGYKGKLDIPLGIRFSTVNNSSAEASIITGQTDNPNVEFPNAPIKTLFIGNETLWYKTELIGWSQITTQEI